MNAPVPDRPDQGTSIGGPGSDDPRPDRGSVPLRAEGRARVPLEVVPRLLDGLAWLGEEISPDERGMRRVSSDLVLGVGEDRPITFRKSMIVGIGPPRRERFRLDGGDRVAIGEPHAAVPGLRR